MKNQIDFWTIQLSQDKCKLANNRATGQVPNKFIKEIVANKLPRKAGGEGGRLDLQV